MLIEWVSGSCGSKNTGVCSSGGSYAGTNAYLLACVQEWDILVVCKSVGYPGVCARAGYPGECAGAGYPDGCARAGYPVVCARARRYAFVPAYEPPLEHTPVFLDPHDPLTHSINTDCSL